MPAPKFIREIGAAMTEKNDSLLYKITHRVILPVYLFLSLGSIFTIAVTMSIDEEKYTYLTIGLTALFFVATAAFLICLRPLRKRQARLDLRESGLLQPVSVRERYEFTAKRSGADLPKLVEENPRCGNFSPTAEIAATLKGIEIEGHFPYRKDGPYDARFFWNDTRILLQSYSARMRAKICFCVLFSDDKNLYLYLPVNAETLGMIQNFGLQVENRGHLDFLLSKPEEAFYQIITYGTIKKTDKFLKEKK